MPRELKGTVFKTDRKGPNGRPLWGYRLHKQKGGYRSGFRTEREAKDALANARDEYLSGRGGIAALATSRDLTIAELADLYLEARTDVEPTTKKSLREHLRASTKPLAEGGFGDLPARALTPLEVATWRAKLPPRSAFHYAQALRQLLTWARDIARVVPENVALSVPNPRPKRAEVTYFKTWADVEAVDAELPEWAAGFAIVSAGVGTRPEDLFAARRLDLDLASGVLVVRRTYSKGYLREYGKTAKSRRRIPLRTKVIDALRETGRIGPGLDPEGLLFPAQRGGFIDLHNFRSRWFGSAAIAAGFYSGEGEARKATHTPYALRHTYAAFSLAAGVNVFTLARRMGTSVKMIDDTYGHLAPDAEQYERDALDEFDRR